MIAAIGSRIAILLFGTLYPAYASYKAVRNKDVKAYVTWMMYWIVFALFTCVETLSDVFLSFWVPFYYELKVVLVLWLLSPATKGSSFLYRKFVHPTLSEREKEIDEYLAKMKERSYSTMMELGSKGINYALQTAIKGGGGLVSQLKKSYSLGDLTEDQVDGPRRRAIKNEAEITDDEDDVMPGEHLRVAHKGYAPRRTQSGSSRVDMYFSAVDVRQRGSQAGDATNNNLAVNKTASTISADVDVEDMEIDGNGLTRTSSLSSRPRTRRSVTAAGPKSPNSRPKSTALTSSAVDVLEAMALNSSFDPFSLDPMHEFYSQSGVIIEEMDESDLMLIEQIIRDKNKLNQLQERDEKIQESMEAEVLAPEILEKINEEEESVDDFFEATEEDAVADSEFSQIEDKTMAASLLTESFEQIGKDEATISEEPPMQAEPKTELLEIKETPEVESHPRKEEKEEEIPDEAEKVPEIPKPEEIPDWKEILEPQEIPKQEELPEIPKTEEVKEKKEKSPDVMMKVEVEFSEEQNLGHATVFRMSLESLPTSSGAASEMQSQLTINSEGLSPSPSSSSLVTSEEGGSSPREARAGRYNKKPAPPRPKEAADEDGPLKARLVLKPGVVRNLPEAAASTEPHVFLSHNAKELKKKSGARLFSFWGSKPDPDAGKSTDL